MMTNDSFRCVLVALIAFLSLGGAFSARAMDPTQTQTFILSDIDDTLKITHVGSATDLATNGLRAGEAFSGLPELFRAMHSMPATYPYYVSAAAGALQKGGKSFLKKFAFPLAEWTFYGKSQILDDTFRYKVQRIKYLISTFIRPIRIILVGDNGERDVDVFDQVMQDLPDVPIRAYVHLVYDKSAGDQRLSERGMVPWLTALDLGLRWQQEYGLSERALQPVVDQVLSNLYTERLIPTWVECGDFLERFKALPPSSRGIHESVLRVYEDRLESRCAK